MIHRSKFVNTLSCRAFGSIDKTTSLKHLLSRTDVKRKNPPKFHTSYGEPVLVIKSLLDTIDIDNIEILCRHVKDTYPNQHSGRNFQNVIVDYVGDEAIFSIDNSNSLPNQSSYDAIQSVVFMEGYMQELMPQLVAHILHTVSEASVIAKWHPYPTQLGIRCIESLVYSTGGRLKMHVDSESIYTVVMMLSDPNVPDFTGGDFDIQNAGASTGTSNSASVARTNAASETNLADIAMNLSAVAVTSSVTADDSSVIAIFSSAGIEVKDEMNENGVPLKRFALGQGDALMFNSNVMHGVDALLTGERNVLVIELWPFEAAQKGDQRPGKERFLKRYKLPTFTLGPPT